MERNEIFRDCLAYIINDLRREWRNEIIRLKREFASYRREWRFERTLLQDEIKVLRKRLDLEERAADIYTINTSKAVRSSGAMRGWYNEPVRPRFHRFTRRMNCRYCFRRHSHWVYLRQGIARSGLIGHVGGSSGHTAPRLMGRTA